METWLHAGTGLPICYTLRSDLDQSSLNFLYYDLFCKTTKITEVYRTVCYQGIITYNCSPCDFSYWNKFPYRSIASINCGKCK